MKESNHLMDTPYSYLIRSIGMKLKTSADARLAELGLNSQQGRMIGYIYENQESGIIQKDLAQFFGRRGASITSMLQGLEKKGYIERRIPENNARQKNIYVLPKGAALVEEFNNIFLEVEESITKGLTKDEQKQLMSILIKVNRSM
ncbi:DNA-binding MarR family transcriptional regulator [Clostridium acetobutylicum]|uniref:Transcriptional regulator, MarR/EmrR family n=2 Tax=Clostridium acetobutylicum TaxID=1488 RepID=Q97G83_CLOAB|nr:MULTISPECIES: MarR family transcriptional regulator [Clostridium]AAK80440.1 Transcriptional regulator, MarR/EmrR family [Clostridium acetobutylicum ATCC 824]ADZ21537.1 Transcriptional regulator, MarR/EmrR family [Clostridium acetobutylicum EA 2018]AEI32378.1 MarR family transcriptional regulator [Clostridium acetobutylicum DSM 1731]AWV79143.1 MarR family transcriptional regulator [Clostridium acetobutylicum]KHD38608.1 MarR family transcriptional regulator [Clostridium acetobutylicum]